MTPQYPPIIADLHCDTVMLMKQGYDISVRNSGGHIDIPRLKDGGVNLQCFACFVELDRRVRGSAGRHGDFLS